MPTTWKYAKAGTGAGACTRWRPRNIHSVTSENGDPTYTKHTPNQTLVWYLNHEQNHRPFMKKNKRKLFSWKQKGSRLLVKLVSNSYSYEKKKGHPASRSSVSSTKQRVDKKIKLRRRRTTKTRVVTPNTLFSFSNIKQTPPDVRQKGSGGGGTGSLNAQRTKYSNTCIIYH